MQITQLKIRNFRNLTRVELNPGPGVNLITGQNASGKTSLLEAVYYLSHLRSFRTPYLSDLINHQAAGLQLIAMASDHNGKAVPIGIERSKEALQVRVDQRTIQRVADITAMFPVLAIHPDSYRLITGSPTERRAFIDWGVFHVEHGFFQAWQRYRKAIAQRNAALRSGQKRAFCQVWDRELDEAARQIHDRRQRYMDLLQPNLARLIDRFFPGQEVRLTYKRGWSSDQDLIDVLRQSLDRDIKRGITQSGPHRADLQIQVDGQSAQTGISRGQQKVLVALLKLAQAQQFTDTASRHCVLLYDDLSAELDRNHRGLILDVLKTMQIQLFVSAIESSQIDLESWPDVKLFHVEQGRVV